VNESSPPRPGASRTDVTGRVLAGRYRLHRLIATGGMAQVWEAEDHILARPVAVKLLHPHLAADPGFVDRFRHEAIAAARLSHPSIVSIYDTVSDDGLEAIVMELVRGITLRARLDNIRTLEIPDAVSAGAQVADALEVAHRAHVVHRDIKPANILLSSDGRVMVADFGIAKALQAGDLTAEGTMLGTAKYLAPEQVEGAPVDARTDLYSLAVVLYESIGGRPPFLEDSDAATALARLHQTPLRLRQLRASVPKAVDEVIMRGMALRPDQRFASAADLRAALLASLQGKVPETLPPPAPSLLPPARPLAQAHTVVGPRPEDPASTANHRPTVASLPAPLALPKRPTSNPPTPPRLPVLPAEASPLGGEPPRPPSRRWLIPVLVLLLIAIALTVAGVLISRSGTSNNGTGTGAVTAAPITSLKAVPYDPYDPPYGLEDNDQAPAVLDGDPNTFWQTSQYKDPKQAFGNLKPGVGIYLQIASTKAIDHLVVQSPDTGWSAQVYVTTTAPPTVLTQLSFWGTAVGSKSNIETSPITFDLHGAKGSYVLLWITRLPATGWLRVSEMKLSGG
jgi:serine/threonine protein kinase